jgi:PPM family protein phosphatase
MQGSGVRGNDDPVVTGRALSVVAAGATDIGQRDHNEDQVLLRPELGLFLLADGAGGHNAGNVASALATTTVANVFETSAATLEDRPEVDSFGLWTVARRLSSAIHQANAEIIDIAKKSEKYHGMGTTLVALAFSPIGDVVHVAHVGDSRCYRMRAGQLEPLTVDHSLIVDVLEAYPDADDALLARTPQNVVTRALGMEESLHVPVRTLPALPGDVYLLCSDGVTDELDDEKLAAILSDSHSPDDLVRTVIEAALSAGAQDNVAAVVISCRETDVLPRRRPSARPEPTLAARAPAASAPEIIIVGVETHIVPNESVDATLLDALGRLTRLRQPSAGGLGVTPPSRCPSCGQPLQKGATSCPTCSSPIAG